MPVSFDLPELEKDFQLAQDLSEILSRLHQITEEVDDTLIAVGSEAMRTSLRDVTEFRLVGRAHPTACQGLRQSAKVNLLLFQCQSSIIVRYRVFLQLSPMPGYGAIR